MGWGNLEHPELPNFDEAVDGTGAGFYRPGSPVGAGLKPTLPGLPINSSFP